jgi:hypothetical protein
MDAAQFGSSPYLSKLEMPIGIYSLGINLDTSTKPPLSLYSFSNLDPPVFLPYVAICSLMQVIQYGFGPVSRV